MAVGGINTLGTVPWFRQLDPSSSARPSARDTHGVSGRAEGFLMPLPDQMQLLRKGFDSMDGFWQSLVFIALAEMGDKTQLVALAFAARFSAKLVLGGVFAATLAVHLFSVALGELLGTRTADVLDRHRRRPGVHWLRALDVARRPSRRRERPIQAGSLRPIHDRGNHILLAELGDKTMLATVTLASQLQSFIPVWLGSTLGMVVADGLAIAIGAVAGKRLPERAIQLAAAAVFIISGVVTLAGAFGYGFW